MGADRTPAPVPADELAPMLAGAATTMLPAAAYVSDDVLEWERRHLFAAGWVAVGRADDVAAAGDRRAVKAGDDAVLLVRDADGALRGFYNTCRHRGHELMPCGAEPVGQRSIHCPYHGWRYGLDGALLSTPRFQAPEGFEPSEHGLVPVAVEEWHGWVMVNASGDAPPLREFHRGLDERVAPYEPERLVVGATHHYELAANWKLIVENYHECFHCPNIHPELCKVSPPTSGENHVDHGGMWVGGWQELMPHAVSMSLDGTSKGVALRGLDETTLRRIDYLGPMPNLLVSLHPDYVMTHRLEPLAPGRTAVECQWLFDPDAAAADGFDPSFAVDFWDLTNRQDWAACESVQRGVSSRGFRRGPFAEDEDAVAQFVRHIAAAYLAGGWDVARRVTPDRVAS